MLDFEKIYDKIKAWGDFVCLHRNDTKIYSIF